MRAEHHTRASVPPLADDTIEESVYRRAGRFLGLSAPIHCEIDLVDRLEKGLSTTVIEALRERVGLTDKEVYELIAPRRTLERRASAHQPLSSEEADKAVRIARVAARAYQILKPDAAREWLRTPQGRFGDRSPLELLATESGARAVEEILVGTQHGFFA